MNKNSEKKEPKLTIVSLSYNHEKYIAQTLESFVMQKTNFVYEVVISDDASTDNTANIIREYALKYPNIIKPILREKNIGAEENYFDALSKVKSEYLLYTDGDDYFTDPLKLQKQVDYLDAHPECSICFHPVKVTVEDAPDKDSLFPLPNHRFNKVILELDDLVLLNFIQTNSCVYRWAFGKDKKAREAFPPNIIPGDWYMHLLHAKKGKIGFIDEVMAVYRRHPGGIWWESLFDLNALHLKHGVNELNFYIAVENEIMEGDKIHHARITSFAKYLIELYSHHQKFEELVKVTNICIDSRIFEEQMTQVTTSF